MARLVQCGLSISPSQLQRIKALAEQQGTRQADVVRRLIDIALPFAEGAQGIDYGRLITILEFTSLALDTLVQHLAPQEADRLLDLAIAHGRKYHAA
jgi:hypothetical protein